MISSSGAPRCSTVSVLLWVDTLTLAMAGTPLRAFSTFTPHVAQSMPDTRKRVRRAPDSGAAMSSVPTGPPPSVGDEACLQGVAVRAAREHDARLRAERS